MIIARSQYDDRPHVVSDLNFAGDPGMTKQADAKDCDINYIMKRFERTGVLPDMIAREPRYGDFSDVFSFQDALNVVNHANEQFMNLDVSIRNRFENDPAKFLAFATDPKNLDELGKMGLLKPETVAARAAASKAAAEAERASFEAAKLAKAQADERALIEKIKAELAK